MLAVGAVGGAPHEVCRPCLFVDRMPEIKLALENGFDLVDEAAEPLGLVGRGVARRLARESSLDGQQLTGRIAVLLPQRPAIEEPDQHIDRHGERGTGH